jgi:hypothetical protein
MRPWGPEFWKTTQRFFEKKHVLKFTKNQAQTPHLKNFQINFTIWKLGSEVRLKKRNWKPKTPQELSHVIGMPTRKKKKHQMSKRKCCKQESKGSVYNLQSYINTVPELQTHGADSPDQWQMFQSFLTRLIWSDDYKTNSMWVSVSLHRLDRISAPTPRKAKGPSL